MTTATATKHTATIPAASLQQAVRLAASVLPGRNNGKACFSDILLEIQDGTSRAHGTDGEIGVNAAIEGVTCDASFRVTTPGKPLLGAIGESGDGEIKLSLEGDALTLKDRMGTYRLKVTDAAEYPAVALCDDRPANLMLPKDLFEMAVDRTVFATDVDSTRYALAGVLIDPSEGVAFVATDSHRLSVMPVQSEAGEFNNESPVIPNKGLAAAKRLPGDEIAIAITQSDVSFVSDGGTVISRLIEGLFPKYRQVIPQQFTNEISLPAGPIVRLLRQAGRFTSRDDSSPTSAVTLQMRDGSLSLIASSEDSGDCNLSSPVPFEGDFSIRLDPKYLLDFFSKLGPTESALFQFIDDESAVLFTAGEWTYLVMPLHKKEG